MAAPSCKPMAAAQYLRMSTEHQNYSLEHQALAIAAYALEHDFTMVRSYVDAGVSGLHLKRRDALQQLLADVLSGDQAFEVVLVYDVSRWGRFQDPDEAAHYEFICRQAGVAVQYCAEPFSNDAGLASTLVKHLKRAMAAEYSRELSVKVSKAQRGLSAKGYWCGSAAPYGFRRCVVHLDGRRIGVLQTGERKALQGCRVVLIAGPAKEIRVVRRIYRWYVADGLNCTQIAARLNARAVLTPTGPWNQTRVRRMLRDEKYAGVLVQGRHASRLGDPARLPSDTWIRAPGGCPALVGRAIFDKAQARLDLGARSLTNESLIHDLRSLLQTHGRLSASVIRRGSRHRPSTFIRRFGGLMAAYKAAGWEPSRRQIASAARRFGQAWQGPPQPYELDDATILTRLAQLYAAKGRISATLIDQADNLPSSENCRRRFGGMAAIYALVGHAPDRKQRAATHPPGRPPPA